MKIIQLIQKPQRRGAEIFGVQLSEELIGLGHEVIIVSIFHGTGRLGFSGKIINLNRDIKFRFFDYLGWSEFAKLVGEWKPDFIQANAADTLKFAVFSKKLFRWKSPIIYRNANQMGDFIRGKTHRAFNQFLLNSITGVSSVSVTSQSDFHQTFKFPKEKSYVIPIGIVPQDIDIKSTANEIKGNLPKSFLIQIGGLVSEKNPLGMVEIFSRLKDKEINLIFLGSGPLEKRLLKKIKELKLVSRVSVVPNQDNVFTILSKSSALIMPSKVEGLPAVILEAMYLKVPVVAYGVGGIPEVLKKGKTGWCVRPNDQLEFIESIEEVFSMNLETKERILSNAFQLVTSTYSLKKIAGQFEDSYFKLLDSSR